MRFVALHSALWYLPKGMWQGGIICTYYGFHSLLPPQACSRVCTCDPTQLHHRVPLRSVLARLAGKAASSSGPAWLEGVITRPLGWLGAWRPSPVRKGQGVCRSAFILDTSQGRQRAHPQDLKGCPVDEEEEDLFLEPLRAGPEQRGHRLWLAMTKKSSPGELPSPGTACLLQLWTLPGGRF